MKFPLGSGEPVILLSHYLQGAQFWCESVQNWQSELLAVLSIVVLSIHLRQHNSPEFQVTATPHS